MRGRDRRHRSPARIHRVNLRFDDDEFDAVSDAATAAGLTTAGYCAETALATARGHQRAGDSTLVLRALAKELFGARAAVNRVGSNVNQVAAAFHGTGLVPEYAQAAIELCLRTVERLDSVVAELRRRLG
ncbi:hypothetical protein SAMN05443668_103593 [Cryptosporangium aurantiacum]|uniref:Mobilisation protein (MobC) n=2 Tax=Cryptosporangium aurantiacum TaxID=134849 RepID=A0A1M7PQX0_9ACTN|nr:hypothetical protein SAMN05443668_103593 [Cryptosporangium aurantiacum]